jgi:hypothetical protein
MEAFEQALVAREKRQQEDAFFYNPYIGGIEDQGYLERANYTIETSYPNEKLVTKLRNIQEGCFDEYSKHNDFLFVKEPCEDIEKWTDVLDHAEAADMLFTIFEEVEEMIKKIVQEARGIKIVNNKDDKIYWNGTQPQLVFLWKELQSKGFIRIDETKIWKILSDHFTHKGNPINPKEMAGIASRRDAKNVGGIIRTLKSLDDIPPK